ncbi:MAG TPA: hypothetical protein VK633_10790, partial [Verrucomicrobiae bacterium]|nr:hypothetical protein [Verrucomicrobiae bacterium]
MDGGSHWRYWRWYCGSTRTSVLVNDDMNSFGSDRGSGSNPIRRHARDCRYNRGRLRDAEHLSDHSSC